MSVSILKMASLSGDHTTAGGSCVLGVPAKRCGRRAAAKDVDPLDAGIEKLKPLERMKKDLLDRWNKRITAIKQAQQRFKNASDKGRRKKQRFIDAPQDNEEEEQPEMPQEDALDEPDAHVDAVFCDWGPVVTPHARPTPSSPDDISTPDVTPAPGAPLLIPSAPDDISSPDDISPPYVTLPPGAPLPTPSPPDVMPTPVVTPPPGAPPPPLSPPGVPMPSPPDAAPHDGGGPAVPPTLIRNKRN